MRFPLFRFIVTVLSAVSILCLSACQKSDALSVSGTVVVDGTPLADGIIAFMPVGASGKGGSAPIVNGSYTVKVLPGKMIVQFYAERTMTDQEKTAYKNNPMTHDSSRTENKMTTQYLPKQFNEQSTIITEIVSNRKDLNFELSTQP